jgi:peptide/nickel transport system substrate-binding protein
MFVKKIKSFKGKEEKNMQKRNRVSKLVVLLVVASILLAACGGGSSPAAAKKVATFSWTQEPDSLNPFYSDMWFASLMHQIYLCWAWQYDDQAVAYPHLVTEMPEPTNEGLTITLNLRDNITWSDGEPITSADFLFTYDMIMDDANAVNSQYPYDYLDSVETPDEHTVVMNFSEPFAAWEANFWHGILPKHILQPIFDAEGSLAEAAWNEAPAVGCGPYVFSEWESGSFIRFEKSDNYWLGEANIDEIFFQFVPDDAAQTAAMIAGDADLGTFPPLSDIPTLRDAGVEVLSVNGGYSEIWFFNFRDMSSPGARDLNVRKAVAMALNRDAIVNDILLGLSKPGETIWDPLAAAGYVSSEIVPWTYDPEGAKTLLETSGWIDRDEDGIRENENGDPLVLKHGSTSRQVRQDIQAVAQQQLLAVGIDLQIQSWESDIFFGNYSDGAAPAVGELDIMEWSDSTYFPDPDTDYWLCDQIPDDENPWGYNYFGCDETLDGLFQQQIVETNPAARTAIIQEISKYMHDQVYLIPLYLDPDIWMVNSRLVNVKISGVTPFYNIMDWDIQE